MERIEERPLLSPLQIAQFKEVHKIQCSNPLTSVVVLRNSEDKYIVKKTLSLNFRYKQYSINERDLMLSLKSDFIVPLLYWEIDQEKLHLYIPYYEHGDLQKYLLEHELPLQCKAKLFVQLLQGLLAMHKQLIFHRDLKMENIFVDENGNCAIGDLGIAKQSMKELESHIGTYGFQAPEVYSGGYSGEKVDVWATGIIAYQLFNPPARDGKSLSYPFGTLQNLQSTLSDCPYQKRSELYLKWMSKMNPNDPSVPMQIQLFIQKTLKTNPTQRCSFLQIYKSGILSQLRKYDIGIDFLKGEYEWIEQQRKQLLQNIFEFQCFEQAQEELNKVKQPGLKQSVLLDLNRARFSTINSMIAIGNQTQNKRFTCQRKSIEDKIKQMKEEKGILEQLMKQSPKKKQSAALEINNMEDYVGLLSKFNIQWEEIKKKTRLNQFDPY